MMLGQHNPYLSSIWRVLVWTRALRDDRPLHIYRLDTNTGTSIEFGQGLCIGEGEQMVIRRRGRHLEVLIEKPRQPPQSTEQHALEAG